MSQITHPELVAALAKPGSAILTSLTPEKCHIWHMASCLPAEAGELFDACKKHVIYEGQINRANVVEEMGDLEFFLEGLRVALGVTREETLTANIAKLRERYEKKTGVLAFTDTAARERLDKAGREGFQMTRERRASNADWPQWLHEAWNLPHIQVGAVGPYVLDEPCLGRVAVKMDDDRSGHPVEWGQWIVREPWGALVIETDFQPGK